MTSALNELRELERQSSAKHAPDVVLDTLEQLKGGPGPRGPTSEPASPLHSRLLKESVPSQHALQRSSSSVSDVTSTFRPAKSPAPCPSPSPSHREPRPPATRPKPVLFPKTHSGGTPVGSPTTPTPPTPPPPPPPPPPTPPTDKSCPSPLLQ